MFAIGPPVGTQTQISRMGLLADLQAVCRAGLEAVSVASFDFDCELRAGAGGAL